MATDNPVIIEVALNGTQKKKRNPNIPVSISELTTDAVECLEMGAHIIHQHDDLDSPGKLGGLSSEAMAEKSAEFYRTVLREVPNAILYPTSNWPGPIETRWGHQITLAKQNLLKMAYVDPGSVNIGRLADNGYPQKEGAFVYSHSFDDIEWMMEQCHKLRVGPNMAIFEGGFLRIVLAYERSKRLPPGAFLKLYFSDSLPFGFRPTSAALEAYLCELNGSQVPWAVAVLGGNLLETDMAIIALRAGGHLRVGLEDYEGPGTPTNPEILKEALSLCKKVGRRIASQEEALSILNLPKRKS
mgnify:CR=1 FL=1